jgi:hypothetical protein
LVSGPQTLIAAVAAGKRAALMIDRYVQNKSLRLFPKMQLPSVYLAPLEMEPLETAVRPTPPHLAVKERFGCGSPEVELPLSEKQALCEARRCLRCDLAFTQPG